MLNIGRVCEVAREIMARHAQGEEMDSLIDAGEWSTAEHADAEAREIRVLAEANGFTANEIYDAIQLEDMTGGFED